jgi:hypothetical protein
MSNGAPGPGQADWYKVATVLSRSLAFLCLQQTAVKDGGVLEKAEFLRSLGLPYGDSAGLIGSSEASIKELARVARKPKKTKGAGRGESAKRKPAKR